MEAAGPRAVFQGFKVPSTIPQDLLLIQDLVSPIIAPTKQVTPPTTCDDDSVDSSGESIDSADEAEAILVSTREIEGTFAYAL
jgi:H/ACA ribonucleoprotein complex non-core subunit NAF1